MDELGDKSKLTLDEAELLHSKVLPTARAWCEVKKNGFGDTVFKRPSLAQQAKRTLGYWGEGKPGFVPADLWEKL